MGCRRVTTPDELVRIARAPDGSLAVGLGPGRGAWLCAGSVRCFELAVRRRALGRALRCEVGGDEIERLRARLYGRLPSEGTPR